MRYSTIQQQKFDVKHAQNIIIVIIIIITVIGKKNQKNHKNLDIFGTFKDWLQIPLAAIPHQKNVWIKRKQEQENDEKDPNLNIFCQFNL